LELKATRLIRNVPDFPSPGILFRDITPVLADPEAVHEVVTALAQFARQTNTQAVAGIESRGFVFGMPVAMQLRVPFIPFRKPGKLPCATLREEYELEYGTAAIEAHQDALEPGVRVLIVDDLLATGGTAAAAVRLVRRLGGVVAGAAFVIELVPLRGRELLRDVEVFTLIRFD